MKKDYLEIVREKGLYAALLQLETDAVLALVGLNKTDAARALRIQRTTLQWKIVKLDLGHLFKSDQHQTERSPQNGNKEIS